MCGIAGHLSRNKNNIWDNVKTFEDMQKSMYHRGPDQKGIFTDDNCALIHSRLSVIDLEKGIQPMSLDHGRHKFTMVYNGELYNTEELRNKLKSLGHKFKSHSDTEVLLHGYAEWGADILEKLNGIYAFAVWDKFSGMLFFARDRMGVKPFFFSHKEDNFIFASEIKTLLVHPYIEPEIDINGLAEIMFIGPGRTPGQGVFNDIKELKAGQYGTYFVGDNRLEIHTYWELKAHEHEDDFEHTAKRVRELVIDSVQRQLISDVPVCTFLSGGLDSSVISSIADRYFTSRGELLKTVSVSYKDNMKYFKASKFQPNSDDEYIIKMNNFLNAENHLITLDTNQLVPALYEAVEARDLPGMADVDSSLLLFCREIKKLGTVALSGECADEIFGGYPWYRDKEIREREGFPWAQSTFYRKTFLKDEYVNAIDPEKYVNDRYEQTLSETSCLPGVSADEKRMKQMINLNFKWFMQTLLDRKDRMSMHSSLEVRVPFCDYRIAEYLYNVPWEYKDHDGYEKGLLREAMRGLLPHDVLWRKKSPYPKTHNPSYLAAVRSELKALLDNENAPLFKFIKKDELEKLLTTDKSVPWYGQLMTTPQTIAYFLQFNYWLDKYKVRLV